MMFLSWVALTDRLVPMSLFPVIARFLTFVQIATSLLLRCMMMTGMLLALWAMVVMALVDVVPIGALGVVETLTFLPAFPPQGCMTVLPIGTLNWLSFDVVAWSRFRLGVVVPGGGVEVGVACLVGSGPVVEGGRGAGELSFGVAMMVMAAAFVVGGTARCRFSCMVTSVGSVPVPVSVLIDSLHP